VSRNKKHFLNASLITSVSGSLGLLGLAALLSAEDGADEKSNYEIPVIIPTGPVAEMAEGEGKLEFSSVRPEGSASGASELSYDVPVAGIETVPNYGGGIEPRRMALKLNASASKSVSEGEKDGPVGAGGNGMTAKKWSADVTKGSGMAPDIVGDAGSGEVGVESTAIPESLLGLETDLKKPTSAGGGRETKVETSTLRIGGARELSSSASAGSVARPLAWGESSRVEGYRPTDQANDEELSVLAGDQRVETWSRGYFPTTDDHFYIGDYDYPRSYGPDNHEWPDLHLQRSMGMFAYDDPDVSFYDEHSDFYGPLDRALGFFTPHEGLVLGSEQLDAWSFALDADIPMFTRGFEPDKAHVKAGPLYLDLMSLGGGVLYSDYSGEENFSNGEEDGWLSFLELQARVLLRISENIYLAAGGRLIFLPGEGKLAFRLGGDYGPNGIARLNYQARLGQWDVLFYDDLMSRYGSDLLNSGAIDRAGRYQFGFMDSYRGHDMFEGDGFHLLNQVGINASRPIEDWRLWLDASHQDRWLGYDFEDHGSRERASAMLSYEGVNLPFSPYLWYLVDSADEFETFHHRFYIGGSGRLTENILIDGRVGYLWTQNREPERDSLIWNLGLTHDLSERLRHGLRVGQDYVSDDFTDDTAVADYIRYDVGYRISSTLYARAHAQWSDTEHLNRPEFSGERQMYGGSLSYRPGGYTDATVGGYYERWDTSEENENERMLYFARISQRIASRTTLWFRYQFEDYETFDEHLYMTGVRKYF
jgi:hypothetical protein